MNLLSQLQASNGCVLFSALLEGSHVVFDLKYNVCKITHDWWQMRACLAKLGLKRQNVLLSLAGIARMGGHLLSKLLSQRILSKCYSHQTSMHEINNFAPEMREQRILLCRVTHAVGKLLLQL